MLTYPMNTPPLTLLIGTGWGRLCCAFIKACMSHEYTTHNFHTVPGHNILCIYQCRHVPWWIHHSQCINACMSYESTTHNDHTVPDQNILYIYQSLHVPWIHYSQCPYHAYCTEAEHTVHFSMHACHTKTPLTLSQWNCVRIGSSRITVITVHVFCTTQL